RVGETRFYWISSKVGDDRHSSGDGFDKSGHRRTKSHDHIGPGGHDLLCKLPVGLQPLSFCAVALNRKVPPLLISPTDDWQQKSFRYPLTEPLDVDILLCAVPALGVGCDSINLRGPVAASPVYRNIAPGRLSCKQIS